MHNVIKASIVAILSAAGIMSSNACYAAGPNHQASAVDHVLGVLAGTAVSPAQLGKLRAGGVLIVSSVSTGSVGANTVGPNSATGAINDNQSINGNTGFTNVFQNTGNNSLFQSSTTISITVR